MSSDVFLLTSLFFKPASELDAWVSTAYSTVIVTFLSFTRSSFLSLRVLFPPRLNMVFWFSCINPDCEHANRVGRRGVFRATQLENCIWCSCWWRWFTARSRQEAEGRGWLCMPVIWGCALLCTVVWLLQNMRLVPGQRHGASFHHIVRAHVSMWESTTVWMLYPAGLNVSVSRT